jgi:hypothetical protein
LRSEVRQMTEYETTYGINPPDTSFNHKPSFRMCRLSAEKNFVRIRELVGQPRYYCKACARVSSHRENLCEPVKL